MPELPEVETIRLQLDKAIRGRRIVGVEVLTPKSFLGDPKKIIGKKVLGVERRAKITLIRLKDGFCLAIHLKLTGQLIFDADFDRKYIRVIITFDNGKRLFFNDLRIFGWIKIVKNNLDLEKLGPEAIDEQTFNLKYFQDVLAKTNRAIKLVILDQKILAGVGNIYANEALFAAKIDPRRPAKSLKFEEIKFLRQEIITVLREAITHHGTSDKDEAYRQLNGRKGQYQRYLQVYGRTGQVCPKCGTVIRRIKIGGRGTFFCQKCQI
ncbi:MAG: DNA-formamidopyrimidine glycosylase [Candidatus Shapirobacteria bacterium]